MSRHEAARILDAVVESTTLQKYYAFRVRFILRSIHSKTSTFIIYSIIIIPTMPPTSAFSCLARRASSSSLSLRNSLPAAASVSSSPSPMNRKTLRLLSSLRTSSSTQFNSLRQQSARSNGITNGISVSKRSVASLSSLEDLGPVIEDTVETTSDEFKVSRLFWVYFSFISYINNS